VIWSICLQKSRKRLSLLDYQSTSSVLAPLQLRRSKQSLRTSFSTKENTPCLKSASSMRMLRKMRTRSRRRKRKVAIASLSLFKVLLLLVRSHISVRMPISSVKGHLVCPMEFQAGMCTDLALTSSLFNSCSTPRN